MTINQETKYLSVFAAKSSRWTIKVLLWVCLLPKHGLPTDSLVIQRSKKYIYNSANITHTELKCDVFVR